ncbi:Imm10 family immunity protein [uncultured Xanthomonas sp.]|uniref:Imm10 family immunity protein n=1 Tax=uncultured Xanthomonas sp. TaxID=152831 RepID=UPI0025FB9145|nr:Imm10 family immunity protein [uncultured Xanthomonas sp.]
MSSFVLQARSIAVEHPEGECHLVGFADQALDTTTYLLLQRAFSFDEQDVALRMDTYHVEWCGQETSGYGGVSQFLLSPGHARITFVPDSPVALAGLGILTIVFQLTPPEYLTLQAALRCIFAGSGCLLVTDA